MHTRFLQTEPADGEKHQQWGPLLTRVRKKLGITLEAARKMRSLSFREMGLTPPDAAALAKFLSNCPVLVQLECARASTPPSL